MSGSTLFPRETGEYIAKNAIYLKVNSTGVKNLTNEIVEAILSKRIILNQFAQHPLHPKATDAHVIEWYFVADTLNFCFWTPIEYNKYEVNGHTGYFALCAALNRALKEGSDITNPKFYSTLSFDALQHIFRSDDGSTQIPLLEQRLNCLQEVGKILLDKWQGKFENVLKSAQGSALKLLQLLVEQFPCFRDEAIYTGTRVGIYKRAQVLIGDLWSCFGGQGLGYFKDLHHITMFADYRVPQVLVHFGALEYSAQLMKILKSDQVLENGDPMEVEIRGASIYIVEQVKDAVLKLFQDKYPEIDISTINSIMIDHYLWSYRRQHAKDLDYIPFHKVLSIYY
uniref:Queuosine 5'-phosphate N-glycosylase/hydrolase n=1 Tax=Glossina brevipalpis TaxID=37001 RepID=A0A1A9WR83_9MUSC